MSQAEPAAARVGRASLLPVICLAGAVTLWGTSYVATKFAMKGFPPMVVMWLRMTIASIVAVTLWRRVPKPSRRRGDWRWLVLLCLLQPCLYFLCEGYALRYTTASQAGMVSGLVPLLVGVGAWLFLRERLSLRSVVGIGVSLVGVAVLSLFGKAQASAPAPLLGNVLELSAIICAAGYMVVLKRLSDRYNPWLLTGLQALVGAVFFLPSAVLAAPGTWVSASPVEWAAAAFLGVFVTLGAFGLYNVAVSRMAAARAAMSINLVPLVAIVTGWLLMGDSLTALQVAACVAIAAGVLFGLSTPGAQMQQA